MIYLFICRWYFKRTVNVSYYFNSLLLSFILMKFVSQSNFQRLKIQNLTNVHCYSCYI